jgi:hypothetical protein
VAFTNNVVRHAEGGINLLGRDDAALSRPASRILVRNNLFVDINSRLFQLLPGAKDIIIEHNTALVRGAITVAEGEPFPAHRLPEQLVAFGKYGILGSGTASGLDTLNQR